MAPLTSQLKWLIGIRLIIVTGVILPTFLYQIRAAQVAPAIFLYLLGFTYAASLVYIVLLRFLSDHAQAYVQFIGDLLLVTGMVYSSGGILSPFSMLYLIVIVVASTLLRRRSGLTIAEIAWILYAALLVSLYYGWIPDPEVAATEAASAWQLIYRLGVHLIAFYVMALLISYVAQNITRTERELEAKSEDLAELEVVHRDVIESIASGIITTDLRGHVTSVNPAGQKILQKSEHELLGHPIYRSGLFDQNKWQGLSKVSRKGRLRDEVTCLRSVGSVGGEEAVTIGFSISDLDDADGQRRGYILIFQDLTDWRKLQEELRIKDRMAAVGELAAGIAHEIGNPLAAVSGSVQMLSSSIAESTAQRRLLDIILQESRRLDRIIKGFLQFARPKDRSNQQFDIARLLEENVDLLRNSEEVTDRHTIEVELDPPTALVVADPDQISQIFWNLARNALRAMPDGGALRVEGTLHQGRYRMQFIDSGKGMSEKERANLFHPFQSFFDGGTGIGMAIVYRIVEEHGGRVLVDSEEGHGTTVTVELPTVETATLSASAGA